MAVTVAIDASGALTWNGEPVSRSTLRRRLKTVAAKAEREAVFCRPAGNTRYRQVERLMKLWQRYGVWTGIVGNLRVDAD